MKIGFKSAKVNFLIAWSLTLVLLMDFYLVAWFSYKKFSMAALCCAIGLFPLLIFSAAFYNTGRKIRKENKGNVQPNNSPERRERGDRIT
jgi:hypothetical protein